MIFNFFAWEMRNNLNIAILFTLFYACYGDDLSCHSVPFVQTTGSLTSLGYSPKCVADALSKCTKDAICKDSVDSQDSSNHGEAIKDPLVDALEEEIVTPSSCAGFLDKESGVKTLYIPVLDRYVDVYCDQETHGGGWTVIQRRSAKQKEPSFIRPWDEYAQSFGSPHGSYWLGLENIQVISYSLNVTLLIKLYAADGSHLYAHYSRFSLSHESQKYKLYVDGFTGNATDSLSYQHRHVFSTYDTRGYTGCATKEAGGWWHADCRHTNLNRSGRFKTGFGPKIIWGGIDDKSSRMVASTMMIRPENYQN